jgi:hypothetical protein
LSNLHPTDGAAKVTSVTTGTPEHWGTLKCIEGKQTARRPNRRYVKLCDLQDFAWGEMSCREAAPQLTSTTILTIMARKVFFSFHYTRDLWRVNVIRKSGVVEGAASAGFTDASLWEEAKKKGDAAIKRLIDSGLVGTSVTVVLIGAETATRQYVTYEIEKSIERGNGLLGVRIHQIEGSNGKPDVWGATPAALVKAGAPVYNYEYGKLGDWVEAAYKKAHPQG